MCRMSQRCHYEHYDDNIVHDGTIVWRHEEQSRLVRWGSSLSLCALLCVWCRQGGDRLIHSVWEIVCLIMHYTAFFLRFTSQAWSHSQRCQLLCWPVVFEHGSRCWTELSRSETIRWFDRGTNAWWIKWTGAWVRPCVCHRPLAHHSLFHACCTFLSVLKISDWTHCFLSIRSLLRVLSSSHCDISNSRMCLSPMIERWMPFCLGCRVIRMDRFLRKCSYTHTWKRAILQRSSTFIRILLWCAMKIV